MRAPPAAEGPHSPAQTLAANRQDLSHKSFRPDRPPVPAPQVPQCDAAAEPALGRPPPVAQPDGPDVGGASEGPTLAQEPALEEKAGEEPSSARIAHWAQLEESRAPLEGPRGWSRRPPLRNVFFKLNVGGDGGLASEEAASGFLEAKRELESWIARIYDAQDEEGTGEVGLCQCIAGVMSVARATQGRAASGQHQWSKRATGSVMKAAALQRTRATRAAS